MTKDFYEDYWTAAHPPPRSDPLTAQRQRLLWQHIDRYLSGRIKLLDAGSGEGGLVAAAVSRGMQASGIEVSEAAISQARQRFPEINVRQHSVEDLPWPVESTSFDVVASFEVIEHLLRPQRLVQGASQSLRPGGYVALTTPYHGLVKNLALAAFGFERHFDVTGGHVRFFTDRTLRRLLEADGFDVISMVHFGRVPLVSAGVFVWARRM